MSRSRLQLAAVFVFVALLGACGGRYYESPIVAPESRILNNEDTRSIIGVMEAYGDALERMDLDALFALISRDYYENAGTTDTTIDDYGYEGITEVFEVLRDHIRDLRVELSVRQVEVEGDRADVLYEYSFTLLYEVAEQQHWETERDVNRVQLARENERWMIIGGL